MAPWDKEEMQELIENELKEHLKLDVYSTFDMYNEAEGPAYISLEYRGRTLSRVPLSEIKEKLKRKK